MTPLLTATPGDPPTYSVGIAETYSWVPILGAGRPLYAQATYLTNASDITVSLSAENVDLNVDMGNYSTASNYISGSFVGNGVGTQVLAANSNRKQYFGQNIGTFPIFVKHGGVNVNNGSFSYILYGGSTFMDGKGEKVSDLQYKGVVSINAVVPGQTVQYIFWEGAL